MKSILYLFTALLLLTSCDTSKTGLKSNAPSYTLGKNVEVSDSLSKAVFAAGCFWCVEAIFESVKGVDEVISGYAGGSPRTARYDMVSSGVTDHAEAVLVLYDSTEVNYTTLLTVLFGSHDPTTLNRQGPDAGRQYRSAIFFENNQQKNEAKGFIEALEAARVYDAPITTTLEPLTGFYPAEKYHQNYEALNPDNSYVQRVSIPRLRRFQEKFPELLKHKHK